MARQPKPLLQSTPAARVSGPIRARIRFAALARCVLLGCLASFPTADASGAAIWRSATSGLWRDGANWTSPTAPTLGTGSVYITNALSKVVLVDSATPLSNLFINGLNVWSRSNVNILRLADVGVNTPLLVSNSTLTVTTGGAIEVTNSSLVVSGRFLGFNLWGGSLTLDDGSIVAREEPPTTNVTVVTRIGRTNEATLTLNGGHMDVTQLLVGESPGAQFHRSRGTVLVNGGSLNVAAEFSIGDGAGCTGLVHLVAGALNVANHQTNIMRIGDFGFGTMTISNATANVGNVSISRHDGSHGALVLLPGGALNSSDDVSVGRFSGSTGMVFVAGGTLRVTNNAFWIGREGSGQLVVSNGLVVAEALHVAVVPTNTAQGAVTLAGGALLVASNFVLGDTLLSTGRVLVAGGELIVSNQFHSARASLASGGFTLDDGALTADYLEITNPASHLNFNGGTVRSGGTKVANGLPFVIGDGLRIATFEMQGGVHEFPDGLVISPNATLSGCGTVIGPIVNHGTIATNATCGGVILPPVITQQPSSQTVPQGAPVTFSVTATGDGPLSYQWRFGVPGAGGGDLPGATGPTLTLTDAQPAAAGHYRVVVSNAGGSTASDVATLRVLVPPQVMATGWSQDLFSLTCASITGLDYILEFKDTLTAPEWTPLPSVPGTGAMLSLTDPTATVPARFYRVRVE